VLERDEERLGFADIDAKKGGRLLALLSKQNRVTTVD
jgi:hypothetical protein